MRPPVYSSNTQDFNTNGNLEHLFRLPGVSCEVCNASTGGSRILPIEFPTQLHDDSRFKSRWPIPDREHAAMQREVAGYLDNLDFADFITFRPGDNFQPAYLDIPTKPMMDFLWPNVRSFVVSERVKTLIFDDLSANVDVVPVHLRKIGKLQINDYPDDLMTYFQVIIKSESTYPRGAEPLSVCPVCKQESFDDQKRELVMHEDMWQGQQIFFLKTTLYMIVTERLAEKIKAIEATNVDFVPV
jgi:hypothetical protein